MMLSSNEWLPLGAHYCVLHPTMYVTAETEWSRSALVHQSCLQGNNMLHVHTMMAVSISMLTHHLAGDDAWFHHE